MSGGSQSGWMEGRKEERWRDTGLGGRGGSKKNEGGHPRDQMKSEVYLTIVWDRRIAVLKVRDHDEPVEVGMST